MGTERKTPTSTTPSQRGRKPKPKPCLHLTIPRQTPQPPERTTQPTLRTMKMKRVSAIAMAVLLATCSVGLSVGQSSISVSASSRSAARRGFSKSESCRNGVCTVQTCEDGKCTETTYEKGSGKRELIRDDSASGGAGTMASAAMTQKLSNLSEEAKKQLEKILKRRRVMDRSSTLDEFLEEVFAGQATAEELEMVGQALEKAEKKAARAAKRDARRGSNKDEAADGGDDKAAEDKAAAEKEAAEKEAAEKEAEEKEAEEEEPVDEAPVDEAPVEEAPVIENCEVQEGNKCETCVGGYQSANDGTTCEEVKVDGARGFLSLHNKYRAKHGAGSLSWDSEVEATARWWACELASRCRISHSNFGDRQGHGENLAWGYGSVERAFMAWYEEVDLYNYNNPGFYGATGHFTQVVWKDTKKLGCAISNCPGQADIHVCPHAPAGNYAGQFEENVLPA